MNKRIAHLVGAASAAVLGLVAGAQAPTAQALDEVTVAYFLEWPTPNQIAQIEETFDEKMGVKVNWKSFNSGNDMSAAMASGDVHISYSQGLIPFIVAVSKGLPITTVGIAVAYAEADNCVVNNSSALDRSTAASTANSLKGTKIATPVGNVTHYKLLRTLAYFGLSQDDVTIVPVAGGNDAAAAFLTDQVDIGCAFGGPLDRMKEQGQVILTGAEQENIGILTFDVISATNSFAEEHPDLLAQFLQVTEDSNQMFAQNPNAHWNTLSEASGLDEATVQGYLGSQGSFSFPSKDAQLSGAWLGGTVQDLTKAAADFFVEQDVIPSALNSYGATFDTSFLSKVR
jgi:taurine transport system substrate-binding protein